MNLFEQQSSEFQRRHIGPNADDTKAMLATIGASSLDELISKTVPDAIRIKEPLALPQAISEFEYLSELKKTASKNKVYKNYIGQGYYGTITPSVILRNVFENPGWYTQYTPYQAEISQGRLESLLNFQTMVADLTGLPISNASLLDEATAAAEAMAMVFHHINKTDKITRPRFFVDNNIFAQTKDVLVTRAEPIGIELVYGDYTDVAADETYFGAILQYPNSNGSVEDYRSFIEKVHAAGGLVVVVTDLLALTLLTSPGELGADVAVGSAQRFGVPMGYGGPHAAFFATQDDFKRGMPGRLIGVSIDAQGNRALRMALQTREQHIKREKATSNICTAQALLANMAAMYAVYHGAAGLKDIATRIHLLTKSVAEGLSRLGIEQNNKYYFDTLHFTSVNAVAVKAMAEKYHSNFHYSPDGSFSITLDETTSVEDTNTILKIFESLAEKSTGHRIEAASFTETAYQLPEALLRTSEYLTHEVFNVHRSESQMMRYMKQLENKDLSLNTSMISLGSCTMKLNAATEMIPVSWPEFGGLHPFAPAEQAGGYQQIVEELGEYLATITGFTACSLQPNSGAQGEYAGLLTIRSYHAARNEAHRNVVLIPISAHGTNPASAVMVGFKVVVVKCDEAGNIDVADLKAKAEQYKDTLGALMVTYPSTHGVFEETIKDICQIIHDNGGLVYMDGANMNAQVGLTSPGMIGADVCHLNLHKTFAIPHGGGGPGMGPICVNDKLAPYLPGHAVLGDSKNAVSAAQYGSASILLISYAYIKMLGADGVKMATEYAILNANYMKARLEKHYKVLYTGKNDTCAHEFIVDLRPFKQSAGIEAEDVAKRLIDYGFHAPTLSFPVPGTIMIEPTESEDKAELDRFCDAMISICEEIKAVESGKSDKTDNPLKNAPHTQQVVCADEWAHPYTRKEAAFPLHYVTLNKFWPSVARVNNTYGDRNLICTCEPTSSYAEA
ncbi:aminomethyl-transferring glycine dehydrogenase [Sediminibacterium ginsengisoli]|uniref:Glycine dehydrogenase (decarboxylating) n=1 Tax=Sediminibacterium ginsengisoli TaxID=413434 RepID=A0A1T4QEA1_9BACT|nr:aminomethyl-transferring glycine dehydrogenase [Sediminibacterium ginsengisoli]SKA02130.1 glycine dehydrogenase [Sediminibacterium ginsengisoli]